MSSKGSIVELPLESSHEDINGESGDAASHPLPQSLHRWRALTLALVFIAIAAVSEGVLAGSQRNRGFPIRLSDTSFAKWDQFIKSFGPAILFTPIFWWFDSTFNSGDLLRPHGAVKFEGGALAEGTTLTDYGVMGAGVALWQSLKRRQGYLGLLASVGLFRGVFASLGGSYFQIVQWNVTDQATVSRSGGIALGYAYVPNPYTPFLSAAGYMETARAPYISPETSLVADGVLYNVVNNGLGYSPFTLNTSESEAWVVTPFELPDNFDYKGYDNFAILNVTTDAAKIIAQCVPSNGPPTITFTNTSYYNIVGQLSDDCVAISTGSDVKPTKLQGLPWFGWAVTAPQACVKDINSSASDNPPSGYEEFDESFAPVGISFFTNSSFINSPFASFAFCYANIERHNVTAYYNVIDGKIDQIKDLGFIENLGAGPNGLAWIADEQTREDQLISTGIGRSVAWTLGEGMVRWAGNYRHPGIIDPVEQTARLEDPAVAARIAQEAWLLYQVIIGTSTLIVGEPEDLQATYIYAADRLTANPPVAHALTVLSGVTGLALLAVFIVFYRRHPLAAEMAADPAQMASTPPKITEKLRFKPTDAVDTILKHMAE